MTTEKSKIKSDFGDFSEGAYSGTSEFPVLGTALGVIYNVDVDRESVTNASIGLKSGDTQTKAGVKYVNGTLTAYNSTKTKIKPSVAEDYTLTGTYEQGKYLRTTDTGTKVADFDWSNVSSSISEAVGAVTNTTASIAEFVWENPGLVVGGIIVGVAIVLEAPLLVATGTALGVLSLVTDKRDET